MTNFCSGISLMIRDWNWVGGLICLYLMVNVSCSAPPGLCPLSMIVRVVLVTAFVPMKSGALGAVIDVCK